MHILNNRFDRSTTIISPARGSALSSAAERRTSKRKCNCSSNSDDDGVIGIARANVAEIARARARARAASIPPFNPFVVEFNPLGEMDFRWPAFLEREPENEILTCVAKYIRDGHRVEKTIFPIKARAYTYKKDCSSLGKKRIETCSLSLNSPW